MAVATSGFSVKSNGSLVVTGNLSEQEEKILTSLLNKDYSLQLHASDFSKLFLKAMDLERGPNNGSMGLGKYDLTEDNFSEIIDLRSYLEGQVTAKGLDNFATRYIFRGITELASQLASKAEVKYNKGTVDKYDFDTKQWNRVFGDGVVK